MSKISEYPGELDMLQTFGIDPQISRTKDGYWCYEFVDSFAIKLKFSFDIFEGSVQTVLSVGQHVVQIVSIEGTGYLRIERLQNNYILMGKFQNEGATTLEIHVEPRIFIKWSSLAIYR